MDRQGSSKHTNPQQNPSKTLEVELEKRPRTFENNPTVVIQEGYHFTANLPPGILVDGERERHLGYIKVESYMGRPTTIQELDSLAEAKRHEETQKSYDPNYLAHPDYYVEYNNKYGLIFQKIMIDFNCCWIDKHANGEVSDADMLKILKKIGKNMRYLLTEAQSKRPHGNLRNGVGITPEVETLFLNLGRADHAGFYLQDIKDLHGFLEKILPTLKKNKSSIQGLVESWFKFLSESCLQVTEDFTVVLESEIHPPYLQLNHVRLIVNYPISWEVDDILFFLANMRKLCANYKLLKDAAFESHLAACYPQWNDCFISNRNTGVLNEVYNAGVLGGNYVDKSTGMLYVPTIAIFAYSCVKHYHERANEYNIRNNCLNDTDQGHIVSYPITSNILAELDKEFPHLIENIYQAYYRAVASGYKHPDILSIEKVLPRVLS